MNSGNANQSNEGLRLGQGYVLNSTRLVRPRGRHPYMTDPEMTIPPFDHDDVEMVGQMASGLPISDSCRVGPHRGDDHRAPFRVEREGDRLLATYWCSEHEQVWTCG
jgi:hypothetical protein